MPEGEAGTPVVSVVVLAYNHEDYLDQCLTSIMSQQVGDPFEVIVAEDRSSDGTLTIANRYAREHPQVVRVVTSERNVGMHANHRRALRATRGRFVAYCEGDDFWQSPQKLQLQLDALERHPEVSGVHSEVDHVAMVSGVWRRRERLWGSRGRRPDLVRYEDLVERNLVQTCSVMLRGEVARSFPDSEWASATYAVEDWPLFLHATSSYGPLLTMPESLATYRATPGSATNLGFASNDRRIRDQFRLISDATDGREDLADARHHGLRTTRDALLLNALESGQREMALTAIEAGRAAGVVGDPVDRVAAVVRLPGLLTATRLMAKAMRDVRLRLRYDRQDRRA